MHVRQMKVPENGQMETAYVVCMPEIVQMISAGNASQILSNLSASDVKHYIYIDTPPWENHRVARHRAKRHVGSSMPSGSKVEFFPSCGLSSW